MNVALSLSCSSIPPFYNPQSGMQFFVGKRFCLPMKRQHKERWGEENNDGWLDSWSVEVGSGGAKIWQLVVFFFSFFPPIQNS